MSKAEHDFQVAIARGAMTQYDRVWYASAASVLTQCGLRNLRCLDLCCGNAEFAEILRDRFGMQVTCADYAPVHLEHARRLGFDVLEVDLDADAPALERTINTVRGQFDLIVSLATIEHVFDSNNVFALCYHALKPNGLFLVNTPNISFAAYRMYSAFSGNRPFDEGHHIRFWTYRFLRTNLFLNGFDVLQDARRFYALPEVVFQRAFRGRTMLTRMVTRAFCICEILQHLPFGKELFTEQLTVLARKGAIPPLGFGVPSVQRALAEMSDADMRARAVERIKQAHVRGWLTEFPYLTSFVKELK